MPGLAPSPSDQQLQPGRGAGPGYYDLPFASAAAVSEGRGCGEGAPEAMSGRPEMGIKLGGLWGSDQEGQAGLVSAPCSPLGDARGSWSRCSSARKNRSRLLRPIKAARGAVQPVGLMSGGGVNAWVPHPTDVRTKPAGMRPGSSKHARTTPGIQQALD